MTHIVIVQQTPEDVMDFEREFGADAHSDVYVTPPEGGRHDIFRYADCKLVPHHNDPAYGDLTERVWYYLVNKKALNEAYKHPEAYKRLFEWKYERYHEILGGRNDEVEH